MIATCATLALLLAQAQGGETITLQPGSDCVAVKIDAKPKRQVTIKAGRTTVRSLVITGGNIRWRSGTIRAAGGSQASGPSGYGVWLRQASAVRFDDVLFTDARKGVVLDGGGGVTISTSRFYRLGEDGVIASGTVGLAIQRSLFRETIGVPKGHPDAGQLRNGTSDVLIEGNTVEPGTQGFTQMDAVGDKRLERVTIRGNTVITDRYHPITLTVCFDCLITGNTVRRAPGSTRKAIILAGQARECGNDVQDAPSAPCAAVAKASAPLRAVAYGAR